MSGLLTRQPKIGYFCVNVRIVKIYIFPLFVRNSTPPLHIRAALEKVPKFPKRVCCSKEFLKKMQILKLRLVTNPYLCCNIHCKICTESIISKNIFNYSEININSLVFVFLLANFCTV